MNYETNNKVFKLIKKILKVNKYRHFLYKILIHVKRDGIKITINKIKQKLIERNAYKKYVKTNFLKQEERKNQLNTEFSKNIRFSIVVPLYNTPENFLRDMIESCVQQTYSNWELCLADGSDKSNNSVKKIVKEYMKNDNRIKYKVLEENKGISENTNECIKMSNGDYIGLFDHDDMLHPSALFEYMKVICENDADFIYCDEDKFDVSIDKCYDPHFKPDFSPDNLRANNYICHFTVFKKNLLDEIGLFRKEFDGSQDHDIILRLTENAKCIVHIPKILYHWRVSVNSVAYDPYAKPYTINAGINAVKDHLDRCNLKAEVVSTAIHPNIYRIKYQIIGNPLISILISNRDNTYNLSRCINAILEKATYKNIEILITENDRKKQEVFDYYNSLRNHPKVKIVTCENNNSNNRFSSNNFGVMQAKGDHLLFLDSSIEIMNENFIEEMLMYSQRIDIGAVGAKLYYPNNTIKHAGIKIDSLSVFKYYYEGISKFASGYMGNLFFARNVSAVSSDCIMIKRSIFNEVSGFEENYQVKLSDIDFCMKIRKAGYLIVWTPYAEAYHFETKSKSVKNELAKKNTFTKDIEIFKARWEKEIEKGDPYYNINLTYEKADFTLK